MIDQRPLYPRDFRVWDKQADYERINFLIKKALEFDDVGYAADDELMIMVGPPNTYGNRRVYVMRILSVGHIKEDNLDNP